MREHEEFYEGKLWWWLYEKATPWLPCALKVRKCLGNYWRNPGEKNIGLDSSCGTSVWKSLACNQKIEIDLKISWMQLITEHKWSLREERCVPRISIVKSPLPRPLTASHWWPCPSQLLDWTNPKSEMIQFYFLRCSQGLLVHYPSSQSVQKWILPWRVHCLVKGPWIYSQSKVSTQ